MDLAHGSRYKRDLSARRAHSDTIRERNEELDERRGGDGVRALVRGRLQRDVRYERKREAEHGLDDREDVPDNRPAARDEVVVGHVERVGGGEREPVGGEGVDGADRADVLCDGGRGRVDGELLDDGLFARVVDNVEVRWLAAVRGPDGDAERVEVVVLWVVFEFDAVGDVEPQPATGVRVLQRAHDRVPPLAPRIAARDDRALNQFPLLVVQLPEGLVLAVAHALRVRVGLAAQDFAV
ncbi:hypothetical protein CVT26_000264 [Gymnopilus dilepis]|uniref:Uncharacterized protein n=1 Tax=Gymnopilus dilepis TaxID=231916 RepID=A0A409VGC3_9AGAR|nr:hypothetical protein CVT26_000264 [Gymnopilus dilepis]